MQKAALSLLKKQKKLTSLARTVGIWEEGGPLSVLVPTLSGSLFCSLESINNTCTNRFVTIENHNTTTCTRQTTTHSTQSAEGSGRY